MTRLINAPVPAHANGQDDCMITTMVNRLFAEDFQISADNVELPAIGSDIMAEAGERSSLPNTGHAPFMQKVENIRDVYERIRRLLMSVQLWQLRA